MCVSTTWEFCHPMVAAFHGGLCVTPVVHVCFPPIPPSEDEVLEAVADLFYRAEHPLLENTSFGGACFGQTVSFTMHRCLV